jgi:hypothetical protein
VNKPDLAVAIADALDIWGDEDQWVSEGETIVGAWHQVVGESLGIPYAAGDDKVGHMERLLSAFGVEWDVERHSSVNTFSGGGGNLKKAAYEDLLMVILEREG